LTASVALACAIVAQPVDAQIRLGGQAAFLTQLDEIQKEPEGDLEGTFGIGPRLEFSPPIPPLEVAVVGQGVYYFPDNGSYMAYGLGAKLGFSTPVVSPYVIGGWQWRRGEPDIGEAETRDGPTVGVGVGLGAIPIFVEVTFEFNDEIEGFPDADVNPMVFQAGVLVGG
jgi:hypothetical protein